MRYRFIDKHRTVWPIGVQCHVLEVSRSGYYAWRARPESRTARRQIELTDRIREIHGQKHHANYGAPRVHRELVAQGYACNRKTVEKLMCRAGIRAKTCRRFRVMTTDSRHSLPIAPNRLGRQFRPPARHRAWTMDITYIPTDEGWLYLALVEDLYSRKIVGWATSERIDSALVAAALNMALEQERPGAGLLAHSDRGVQYASDHFQTLLARHGIVCSMSRKGNCWDNAPTESLVATIKKELVHHEHYATRDEARRSLFEYIEVFYNRQRRHSALDYQTPDAVHRGWNREEGRGGLGERGLVSPKSKNNRGAAAPPLTNYH
jgi:transposase InsO family protein